MEFIDSCFNATHKAFAKNLDKTIAEADAVGVKRMIVPGSSLNDSRAATALAVVFPDHLRAAVGVHPHLAEEWNEAAPVQLKELTTHPMAIAIGETGLDYYRNHSRPERQRLAFEQQIELAIQTGLPIFMHQRNAHEDFLALLVPHKDRLSRGLLHCFTGDKKELFDYLDLDLHIGITGWICDERRGLHLKHIIQHVPLNRLMLETDAPYLLPRTLKSKPSGRRNEPAFLIHIAGEIAACLKLDLAELAAQTTANTVRFFDWKERATAEKPGDSNRKQQ